MPFRGNRRPEQPFPPVIDSCWGAWLAGLAHCAYHPNTRLATLIESQGCHCHCIVEKAGIRAYLAADSRHRYLVFCGTRPSEKSNILTDADARWQSHPGGGRCHHGFHQAFELIWPLLADHLDDGDPRPLLLCGHSLGAALALLAGTQCQATAHIGFGNPRLGDAAFCQQFKNLTSWRFQHGCDLVGHVPPADLGWQHHGHCVFIDRDMLIDPPALQMRRLQLMRYIRYIASMPWTRRNTVLVPQLADHSIVAYQDALRNLAGLRGS